MEISLETNTFTVNRLLLSQINQFIMINVVASDFTWDATDCWVRCGGGLDMCTELMC